MDQIQIFSLLPHGLYPCKGYLKPGIKFTLRLTSPENESIKRLSPENLDTQLSLASGTQGFHVGSLTEFKFSIWNLALPR